MDNHGMNGLTATVGQYETPFADMKQVKEAESPIPSTENFYSNYLQEVQSPFSRTYEPVTAANKVTPAGEELVQFLGELNDAEFSTALYELADELEDSWQSKISNEAAMGSSYIPFATQKARDYFAPLIRESETMIDRVSQHFSGNNLADHSETSIESFFTNYEYDYSRFTPAQENLFGGIFNKVKNVVKKGVDLAKKGISVIGKLLPINIILDKIKGLVRPLLDKVLKFAIGKLPKNLQPHAQTLAKKFLNLETNYESGADAPTGELDAIQSELDHHISQLVFSGEETQAEDFVMSYESSFETIERNNNYETGYTNPPDLNAAKQQFIDELKTLQPGDSPAPAIERFLPAAIMALQPVIKMGISIVGRQKIINFLAGLLAKLVGKYVPATVAQPLAANIIDVGMSAIGFEVHEMNKPDLAYEAIANTIEETVQNMNDLNEATLSSNEDLTLHLLEAFEQAAANNFPSQYIREELRPAPGKQAGTWIQMPRTGPKHLYKKYSHVFDVTLDPQALQSVTTFRGLPLANFLKDKYGLDTTKPIQAKVHLYAATPQTRLSRISKHENLPGFNSKQPRAWVQLHPLTKQAATVLLNAPALGKDTAVKDQAKRIHVQAGQRFYFLEINGVKLRIPPVARVGGKTTDPGKPGVPVESHSGDIQGVINFVKSEIRISYYFSEEDAKAVVEKLNRNDFLGAAMAVRYSVKSVLNDMLQKNITTKVKIIHEAMPELYLEHYQELQDQFSVTDAIGKFAGKEVITKLVEQLVNKISTMAYEALGGYFKARAAEFKEAQAQPQDGVTIQITWANIQGMSGIRAVINAIRGNLSIGSLSDLTLPGIPTPTITIVADKKFD
jgi:hypothetical protein